MSTLDKPQAPRCEPPGLPEQSLVDAYRTTDFVVKTAEAIVLRVDSSVPHLKDWLAAQRCDTAVVITAWNPFSQSLPKEENARRNRELHAAIEVKGFLSAPAVGRARTGNWDPEESFCAFDVPPQVVDEWMQLFGQYAVVSAEKAGACRLLWHPSIRAVMAAREEP